MTYQEKVAPAIEAIEREIERTLKLATARMKRDNHTRINAKESMRVSCLKQVRNDIELGRLKQDGPTPIISHKQAANLGIALGGAAWPENWPKLRELYGEIGIEIEGPDKE